MDGFVVRAVAHVDDGIARGPPDDYAPISDASKLAARNDLVGRVIIRDVSRHIIVVVPGDAYRTNVARPVERKTLIVR